MLIRKFDQVASDEPPTQIVPISTNQYQNQIETSLIRHWIPETSCTSSFNIMKGFVFFVIVLFRKGLAIQSLDNFGWELSPDLIYSMILEGIARAWSREAS